MFHKQKALAACSPLLASAAWLLDVVFCSVLHNPWLACLLTLGLFLRLQYSQVSAAWAMNELSYFDADDYLLDVFHNIVNLVFILRFAMSLQSLTRRTNLLVETALLVLQEFGVVVLLFYPKYSLLYSDISVVLRVFIWWQILCPYIVLIFNVIDSNKDEVSEKGLVLKSPVTNLLTVIVETNNNMLPVFMAHSFATINFDFPFHDGITLPLVYHVGVISIKFYIICRFILYELVVVVFSIANLKSFAELYTPVQIGNTRKVWLHAFSRFTPSILLLTTFICILSDVGIIMLSKYGS